MRRDQLVRLVEETREMMEPEWLRRVRFRGKSYTIVALEPPDVERLVRAVEVLLAIRKVVDRATRRRFG